MAEILIFSITCFYAHISKIYTPQLYAFRGSVDVKKRLPKINQATLVSRSAMRNASRVFLKVVLCSYYLRMNSSILAVL